MYSLAPLLLSAGLCCAADEGLMKSRPGEEPIRQRKFVVVRPPDANLPPNARMIVRGGGGKVVVRAPRPVRSIHQGLPYAQQTSPYLITAATEVDGWFFYTIQPVSRNKAGRPTAVFISGYAIRRDGQDVVEFSVW
jgi:hypothetical protein